MQRPQKLLRGKSAPEADDIDEFNAEAVARYQLLALTDVQAKIASALENKRIHLCLWIDAIDHDEDHRLPLAPACARSGSDEECLSQR